jgi:hypothetical protein
MVLSHLGPSQSHVTTDGQSVRLGAEPHLVLMNRFLLLSNSSSFVRRPLWREDGSVICLSHTEQNKLHVYFLVRQLSTARVEAMCMLFIYPVWWYCRIRFCNPLQIYARQLLISVYGPGEYASCASSTLYQCLAPSSQHTLCCSLTGRSISVTFRLCLSFIYLTLWIILFTSM